MILDVPKYFFQDSNRDCRITKIYQINEIQIILTESGIRKCPRMNTIYCSLKETSYLSTHYIDILFRRNCGPQKGRWGDDLVVCGSPTF